MLTSELVTPIREAVSDTVATYRHSDAELFRYIGRAVTELYSLHPEAFMEDDYVLTAPDAPTALTTVIPLMAYWASAIVHRVAGMVLGQDSEEENNRNLAADHYAKWRAEL